MFFASIANAIIQTQGNKQKAQNIAKTASHHCHSTRLLMRSNLETTLDPCYDGPAPP
jgi:hypothetical protein